MTAAGGARTRHLTAADGTRIAYHLLGEGPPLVCVPGGPARDSAYLEDLGGLAASRTLVLVDARGTGASEQPADPGSYRVGTLADDLDRVRADLGLDRMDVLGHSAGGRVAMHHAVAHPDRVARLVLVTTWLRHAEMLDLVRAEAARIRAGRSAAPWYDEEAADALDVAPKSERSRLERLTRPFWYARWGEREQAHAASADTQVNLRAAVMLARTGRDTDVDAVEAALARLPGTRVLVVAGAQDAVLPPVCSRHLLEVFTDAGYVELAGSSHFPWVDEPAAFAAAVEGFLADGGPGAGG